MRVQVTNMIELLNETTYSIAQIMMNIYHPSHSVFVMCVQCFMLYAMLMTVFELSSVFLVWIFHTVPNTMTRNERSSSMSVVRDKRMVQAFNLLNHSICLADGSEYKEIGIPGMEELHVYVPMDCPEKYFPCILYANKSEPLATEVDTVYEESIVSETNSNKEMKFNNGENVPLLYVLWFIGSNGCILLRFSQPCLTQTSPLESTASQEILKIGMLDVMDCLSTSSSKSVIGAKMKNKSKKKKNKARTDTGDDSEPISWRTIVRRRGKVSYISEDAERYDNIPDNISDSKVRKRSSEILKSADTIETKCQTMPNAIKLKSATVYSSVSESNDAMADKQMTPICSDEDGVDGLKQMQMEINWDMQISQESNLNSIQKSLSTSKNSLSLNSKSSQSISSDQSVLINPVSDVTVMQEHDLTTAAQYESLLNQNHVPILQNPLSVYRIDRPPIWPGFKDEIKQANSLACEYVSLHANQLPTQTHSASTLADKKDSTSPVPYTFVRTNPKAPPGFESVAHKTHHCGNVNNLDSSHEIPTCTPSSLSSDSSSVPAFVDEHRYGVFGFIGQGRANRCTSEATAIPSVMKMSSYAIDIVGNTERSTLSKGSTNLIEEATESANVLHGQLEQASDQSDATNPINKASKRSTFETYEVPPRFKKKQAAFAKKLEMLKTTELKQPDVNLPDGNNKPFKKHVRFDGAEVLTASTSGHGGYGLVPGKGRRKKKKGK